MAFSSVILAANHLTANATAPASTAAGLSTGLIVCICFLCGIASLCVCAGVIGNLQRRRG